MHTRNLSLSPSRAHKTCDLNLRFEDAYTRRRPWRHKPYPYGQFRGSKRQFSYLYSHQKLGSHLSLTICNMSQRAGAFPSVGDPQIFFLLIFIRKDCHNNCDSYPYLFIDYPNKTNVNLHGNKPQTRAIRCLIYKNQAYNIQIPTIQNKFRYYANLNLSSQSHFPLPQ